jgi:DNA-binding MarR family transcriptional regulator
MALPPTWNLFGGDHIPHRLLLLARMLDRETARMLQHEFALTVAEWRVLAFLNSVGPSSAADIGAAFESDRAEVSRAVARLTDGGLIVRAPDTANRKKMILSPTPAGTAIFAEARQARQRYFQAILQDLSPEERGGFNASLHKIAERVALFRDKPDTLPQ